MRKFFIVFIVFICIILLFLASCGAENIDRQTSSALAKPQQIEPGTQAGQTEPVTNFTLREQSLPLPTGMGTAQGQCYLDGRVYSFGNLRGPVLGFTSSDGTTDTFEIPSEDAYIHAICPAEGQLAVLAGTPPAVYEDAVGTIHETVLIGEYEILQYSTDGELLQRIPLQQIYTAQTDAFFDMAYDGNAYEILAPHQITRIGSDGAELGRSELDTNFSYHQIDTYDQTVLLGVGDVAILQEFWRLNPDTLTVQSSFAVEEKSLTGIGFDRSGNLLICDETNTVQQVDWEAQTGEKIFSWSENAQTSAQNYLRFYESDSGWLALEQRAGGVKLYRVYHGEQPEKIKLTLTEVGIFDGLSTLVDEFNRSSDTYEIELITHTNDLDQDRQQLLISLTASPSDLYAGSLDSSLPLNDQAFVDLSPWLAADREIYNLYVPNLRDRLCKYGACYELPYEFAVRTYYGEQALFDGAGITVEALQLAVENSQYDYALDGTYCDMQQLEFLAQYAPEFYVDDEDATCDFNSDAFVRMLKLCKQAGEYKQSDIPDAAVMSLYPYSGALLMDTIQNAGCIRSAMPRPSANGDVSDVEDFVYVGYPNETTNGSAFMLGNSFAISALSEHKDGAWAFIRFVLSNQGQGKGNLFPVNDEILRQSVEDQLTVAPEYRKYDEQDAQKFYDALYATTNLLDVCPEISAIVREEGTQYLHDQLTAEAAAENIQSRVSLYLMEQHR